MQQVVRDILETVMDFEQEAVEQHGIFNRLQHMKDHSSDLLLEAIQEAQKALRHLANACLQIPKQNQFLIEHIASGIYKDFHAQRIRKLEGQNCFYEKALFIESMTLKALETNRNFPLTGDGFWSPKTVKDTDEAVHLFLNWYHLEHI